LYLERTNITNVGIKQLKDLSHLQYINLVGTKITYKGLEQLKGLKKLQQVYLYQTSVTGNDLAALREIFPKVLIDTGGYMVPMLQTDTMLVKPPKVK